MTTRDDAEICGALMTASTATTREQAVEALRRASRAGLPMQTAAELLDTWDEMNAPQVVGGDVCKCSHIAAGHYRDKRGRVICSSAACGCAQLRTGDDK